MLASTDFTIWRRPVLCASTNQVLRRSVIIVDADKATSGTVLYFGTHGLEITGEKHGMEHLAHVGAQRGTLEKLFGREIGQFGHIVHTDYLKALAAENLEFAAYPLVFARTSTSSETRK